MSRLFFHLTLVVLVIVAGLTAYEALGGEPTRLGFIHGIAIACAASAAADLLAAAATRLERHHR